MSVDGSLLAAVERETRILVEQQPVFVFELPCTQTIPQHIAPLCVYTHIAGLGFSRTFPFVEPTVRSAYPSCPPLILAVSLSYTFAYP